MYDYIKGKFKGIFKDYVSIENGGIGYKVYTSGNSMAMMPGIDEEATLYLTQIVREDFIGLYGFTSRDELELFSILITINGVGAKAALSLLSASSPDNLKFAIVNENESLLVKAPGIGKKIAQRLILELKGKLKIEDFTGMDETSKKKALSENISNEALAALMTLGYTEKEAKTALKHVEEDQSIERIIKDALKYLMN
ncbi:Holliday junction branch migration protein RuvA [Proteiniclasticum sp. SCR006]|uniref:Holliday junction branch migration complex subunit RuvA n=1 Tax=Proteiniclasticum aestuarii TaxID=2817862 RepID=A0A939H881_9CLOT|nr:Holliday junction branch migration protein RuvA [Proteiniclasticum aestuarii]MBO1263793.1 Holliday junction branch migration protein RuvA [Proteiniclasticum aestuarii]